MENLDDLDDLNAKLGFASGFAWSMPNNPKEFVEYPISITFLGAIYGGVCYLGSGFVSSILPNEVKPVLTALLSASTFYKVGYMAFRTQKKCIHDKQPHIRFTNQPKPEEKENKPNNGNCNGNDH